VTSSTSADAAHGLRDAAVAISWTAVPAQLIAFPVLERRARPEPPLTASRVGAGLTVRP